MPNGTYGGVRGKETKVGQKTFVSRPTRFYVLRFTVPTAHIEPWEAFVAPHRAPRRAPRLGCFLAYENEGDYHGEDKGYDEAFEHCAL